MESAQTTLREDLVLQFFFFLGKRFSAIVVCIRQKQLSVCPDKVVWTATASGICSIPSTYQIIRRKGRKKQWHRLVWHRNSTPRCSFLLWLLMLNKLKTRNLLQKRKLNIEEGCLLCPDPIEECNHLFFKCPFTAHVWEIVLSKVGIRRMPQQWSTELNWLKKTTTVKNRKARTIRSLFATSVWACLAQLLAGAFPLLKVEVGLNSIQNAVASAS